MKKYLQARVDEETFALLNFAIGEYSKVHGNISKNRFVEKAINLVCKDGIVKAVNIFKDDRIMEMDTKMPDSYIKELKPSVEKRIRVLVEESTINNIKKLQKALNRPYDEVMNFVIRYILFNINSKIVEEVIDYGEILEDKFDAAMNDIKNMVSMNNLEDFENIVDNLKKELFK